MRLRAKTAHDRREPPLEPIDEGRFGRRVNRRRHFRQLAPLLKYDFFLAADKKRMVMVSCLDNLMKGAAGQAVQNMNLMFGWNEEEGLR